MGFVSFPLCTFSLIFPSSCFSFSFPLSLLAEVVAFFEGAADDLPFLFHPFWLRCLLIRSDTDDLPFSLSCFSFSALLFALGTSCRLDVILFDELFFCSEYLLFFSFYTQMLYFLLRYSKTLYSNCSLETLFVII